MKSLFSFEGRISRATFWANIIIGGIFLLVPIIIGELIKAGTFVTVNNFLKIFLALSSVATLVIGLIIFYSASIRRFHDRDKSGWWSLISVVPYIGGVWVIVDCGILQGTMGANRFGLDPLTPSEQSSSITTSVVTPTEVTQAPNTP